MTRYLNSLILLLLVVLVAVRVGGEVPVAVSANKLRLRHIFMMLISAILIILTLQIYCHGVFIRALIKLITADSYNYLLFSDQEVHLISKIIRPMVILAAA